MFCLSGFFMDNWNKHHYYFLEDCRIVVFVTLHLTLHQTREIHEWTFCEMRCWLDSLSHFNLIKFTWVDKVMKQSLKWHWHGTVNKDLLKCFGACFRSVEEDCRLFSDKLINVIDVNFSSNDTDVLCYAPEIDSLQTAVMIQRLCFPHAYPPTPHPL